MLKFKLIINVSIISVICLMFCSCNENKNDIIINKKNKITIGFSMDSLVNERWLKDREFFTKRANELGADVIIQTANSDDTEQEKQIRYLLKQNIDVLVVVPHNSQSISKLIRSIKNKGVKVISYDRLIKNANVDLYISFDNFKVGQLMGEAAIEKKPKGNYLILNGAKTDNNSYMFNKGYKSVIMKKKEIKIVGEIWVENWLYEDAFKYVEEQLRNNTKIDAIIAANDYLAEAAINALAEKRLAGKVTVIGHDADLNGCQRVVEGTQYATIYKPIDTLAKITAEYAVNLAKENSIQANHIINDGKYDVPYCKISPSLVKKENIVDVIIKNNFHDIEDVYMNIPKSQWPKLKK